MSHAKLFIVSFFVYAVLNIVENFIHYNIGRNEDRKSFAIARFEVPSFHDWSKIVGVMVAFALLQALLTSILMA